jgi:cation-transporting ATPase 13A3/4/5
MCFDKTGTLTEEGLDVLGFRFTVPMTEATLLPEGTLSSPPENGACRFSRLYTQADEVVPQVIQSSPIRISTFEPKSPYLSKLSGASLKYATIPSHPNAEKEYKYPLIMCAMATCHSIKVVDSDLVGDPLDLKMFSFTGWEISENAAVSGEFGHIPLVEPPKVSRHISPEDLVSKIGVVRIFDFVSSLRRMSVIIKRYHLPVNSPQHIITHSDSTDYEVFVKGAPEEMKSICIPNSIPNNYDEQLRYYSHHGYRVIAIGHSILSQMSPSDIQEARRSAVEENIQFLGFIIFENKLKVGTASVVNALNEANIRQVMVTGIFLNV